jgi:Flp pilus assembly protein TadG
MIRRRRRDERGATAVFVAIMAVMLVGLASFTLDYGQAYAGKRQLQTATDAAALAAAAVYGQKSGTCDQLTDPASSDYASNLSQAQTAATSMLKDNLAGAVLLPPIQVTCNANQQVVVDVGATNKTGVTLGAVYGVKSITTERDSQATEVVPTTAIGARPYMLCSKDVPSPPYSAENPSPVTKISFPGTGGGGAECDTLSGNWWTIQCPGEPKDLAEQTLNGCKNPITIVPDQDSLADPDTGVIDPTDLSHYLLNDPKGCGGGYSDRCLRADTCNDFTNSNVLDAWASLLGKSIILPVFCGGSNCDGDALSGSGSTGEYPVYRLAAVTICGYHWNKQSNKKGQITTGSCANNPSGYDAVGDMSQNNSYLLVNYTSVKTGGSTGPSVCGQGQACDNGVHSALLTR